MRNRLVGSALAILLASSIGALAQQTPAPPGAKVYFINLAQGAHVKGSFLIQFGLSGMGIAPAGTQVEGTGHHHLLIDTDLPPAGEPIPADDKHRHFGKGQTETMLQLPPGPHTLQLEMGDWSHIPFVPPIVSDKISIVVDP
jgi:Domain of unknown function (DUF4399)